MSSQVQLEKGSLSFRIGKKSVAVVLSCYNKPHKVIRSVAIDDVGSEFEQISRALCCYRNGPEKWEKFVRHKLPLALRRRAENDRVMSYEQIKSVMADVAFSLEKHRAIDVSGADGGKELAADIWESWQGIRAVISNGWRVTESQTKQKKM
ncbi:MULTISPECIES: hypothetical protein [Pseudomonas]|uniref:hypothetical protein n=1 Tax=Pseudomonas TaxID=286 RepID=UPI001072DE32|nr:MULTISPECIES: hypothetical protein [Pseudomonas]MDG9889961.1 hypothetical protein [Pseudomonas juntendi]QOH70623.1 hypothetical protein IGB31_24285 [Pseudomonas putida]